MPSRAIKATFEFEDGHWIYGVIVVSGKTLREVEIDARSGTVGDIEGITPAGEARETEAELRAVVAGARTSRELTKEKRKGSRPL